MTWFDLLYQTFGIGLIVTLIIIFYRILKVSNQSKTGIPMR